MVAAICPELIMGAFKVADAPLNRASTDTISVLIGMKTLFTSHSSRQRGPI